MRSALLRAGLWLIYPLYSCIVFYWRHRLERMQKLLDNFDQSSYAKTYAYHKTSIRERAKLLEPAIVAHTRFLRMFKKLELLGDQLVLRDDISGNVCSFADVTAGRVLDIRFDCKTHKAKQVVREFLQAKDVMQKNLLKLVKIHKSVLRHMRRHGLPGSSAHEWRYTKVLLHTLRRQVSIEDQHAFYQAIRDLDQDALAWEKQHLLSRRQKLKSRIKKLQGRLSLFNALYNRQLDFSKNTNHIPLSMQKQEVKSNVTNSSLQQQDYCPVLPYRVQRDHEVVDRELVVDDVDVTILKPWTLVIWKNGPETETVLPCLTRRAEISVALADIVRTNIPQVSMEVLIRRIEQILGVFPVERPRTWKTLQHAEPRGWYTDRVTRKIRIIFEFDDTNRIFRFLIRNRDKAYRNK